MKYEFDIALSFATENQELVEKVYHYLRAYKLSVFFAPSDEAQPFLTGRNQSEAFYDVFAIKSKYVALFVSKFYVYKDIPQEEANIAFIAHGDSGRVIPIYIDGTELPRSLINLKERNYFQSNNPAMIAKHLATKVKQCNDAKERVQGGDVMNVVNNHGTTQYFIKEFNGEADHERNSGRN